MHDKLRFTTLQSWSFTGKYIPKLELGNEKQLELGNEKQLELGNEKRWSGTRSN